MNRKQQVIDIWRASFDDTDSFIDLFFNTVYKEENVLTIEDKGQVVSALQMLPYTLNYLGTALPASYIYGVCTAPTHRGRGLAGDLLHRSFDEMASRGIALTLLIPASAHLFDYYRARGYTESFFYTPCAYTGVAARPDTASAFRIVDSLLVPPSMEQYHCFDRLLRQRPCCMLHTYDDFITNRCMLQSDGGQLLTAINPSNEPVGMAFVVPLTNRTKKEVFISELLYNTNEVRDLLLQAAAQQNDAHQVTYKAPSTTPRQALPLGMARILDTHRLIHLWADQHPHSPISIKEMEAMDNQHLTQQLLNSPNEQAYMSLMLD